MTMRGPLVPPVPPSCPCPIPRAVRRGAGRPRRAAVRLGISTAAAASVAPSAAVGAIGHDVSTPQCGRTLPEIGAFGVVRVNGGRAFTENPCFAAEQAWAKRRPAATGVYINTGNPAPRSDF